MTTELIADLTTDLATDLTAVALMSPVILLVLRLALRPGRPVPVMTRD